MAVTVAFIRELLVEILNESDPAPTAIGVITGERYKSAEIDRAILLADASALLAFIAQPGSGRRIPYLTTQTGVAHGAILTSMVGPIESVLCVVTGGSMAGTHAPEPRPVSYANELTHENRNPQALTLVEPHYILDGAVFFHNGAGIVAGGASSVSFNVVYCAFTFNSSATSIQSPDEAARAIACGALAILFAKDGHKVGAAQHFEGMWRSEVQRLGISGAQLQTEPQ